MTPSRRSVIHPPVLSTKEHAEAEAAFLTNSHNHRTHNGSEPQVPAPESPATLWATTSTHRYAATLIDCVPDRLDTWVAPVIEVTVHV